MAIINVICLNLAAIVYTLTGAVDITIWDNLFADIANNIINMI